MERICLFYYKAVVLKKRLMPILLSVALAGCSNLFGSSFTQTLQRDANASSEFYMNKLGQTQDKEGSTNIQTLSGSCINF